MLSWTLTIFYLKKYVFAVQHFTLIAAKAELNWIENNENNPKLCTTLADHFHFYSFDFFVYLKNIPQQKIIFEFYFLGVFFLLNDCNFTHFLVLLL